MYINAHLIIRVRPALLLLDMQYQVIPHQRYWYTQPKFPFSKPWDLFIQTYFHELFLFFFHRKDNNIC